MLKAPDAQPPGSKSQFCEVVTWMSASRGYDPWREAIPPSCHRAVAGEAIERGQFEGVGPRSRAWINYVGGAIALNFVPPPTDFGHWPLTHRAVFARPTRAAPNRGGAIKPAPIE
jgi:hypothetical protein